MEEMCSISRGIRKIMSPVVPFCLIAPLIYHTTNRVKTCSRSIIKTNLQGEHEVMSIRNGRLRDKRPDHRFKTHRHNVVLMTHPMGVNVSKPFTADQGRPFFFTSSCMFRAVMSTANAKSPNEHSKQPTNYFAHRSPQCATQLCPGKCPDRLSRLRGQVQLRWNSQNCYKSLISKRTFMVCYYAAWDFDLSSSREVARRRLEKEERLFRPGIVELLDVLRVVSANGNDLSSRQQTLAM
jgi:hypothetical protein